MLKSFLLFCKIISYQIFFSSVLLIFFLFFFTIKRQLYPSSIIFYEGAIVGAIFILIIAIINQRFMFLKIHTLLPAFLLIILFNSIIPTILDRSVSITVLGTLNACEKNCNIEHLQSEFTRIYLKKNQSVKKRVNEQISSNNVKELDGIYSLTIKGEITLKIMSELTDLFNIKRSYIDQN